MVIIIIAALVLAAPFIARAYLRLANRSAGRAHEAWHLTEGHARVLLEDKRVDPLIGDLVEAVINHVGTGQLTRSFLWGLVVRPRHRRGSAVEAAIATLNADQEKQFLHFLISALFYDSLRAPLAGAFLRRAVLYWLSGTATDRTAPISRNQAEPVMSAAGRMCAA